MKSWPRERIGERRDQPEAQLAADRASRDVVCVTFGRDACTTSTAPLVRASSCVPWEWGWAIRQRESEMRSFSHAETGERSPSRPGRTPHARIAWLEDRGVEDVLRGAAPSSERWRARAGYVLLGTAFLTSPLVLPFELALLMLVLRGTLVGAAILERLHLVFLGSVAYCLAALATACLALRSVRNEAR
jgi:hypothetical protein